MKNGEIIGIIFGVIALLLSPLLYYPIVEYIGPMFTGGYTPTGRSSFGDQTSNPAFAEAYKKRKNSRRRKSRKAEA